MTRPTFAAYVAGRFTESAAIAAGAAAVVLRLQQAGWWRAAALPGLLHRGGPLVWPALAAGLAHVLLGPKQRRPFFRRVPGAMYAYAGIAVSRSAGCRGGYVLGSTGSGKTLACIYPRLHSLCVNEGGIALPRPRRAEAGGTIPAASRWRVPPWGGLVFGEKGNEWEAMAQLFRCHGRVDDLCILRTRPAGAGAGWRPEARFNLLGESVVAEDTYARLLVEASLAVEETDKPDDFFVPQARDKIAWGLRLLREGAGADTAVTLPRLLEVLTSRDGFLAWADLAAASPARRHLEVHYWSQPPDQLGGLMSTIYNILAPYCEPDIAEIFCSHSTVTLAELEVGRVLCLAIPQRLAVQRRYVATILKGLVYQLILQRFDRPRDDEAGRRRNVIVIEQDEWQRFAVRADGDVDVIREAAGTTYTASQTQDAVWSKLGSREAAAPLIANLRNRWICQAGTEACAEESARLLGERAGLSVSRTRTGAESSRTFTPKDESVLPKALLRSLPPFHVVFAPAEGAWLYRLVIAMPVLPNGEIPSWWFGTWNLWQWCRPLVGRARREDFVPPWRAQAPWRAQFRWLLGWDGTYIVLRQLRRQAAQRHRSGP